MGLNVLERVPEFEHGVVSDSDVCVKRVDGIYISEYAEVPRRREGFALLVLRLHAVACVSGDT